MSLAFDNTAVRWLGAKLTLLARWRFLLFFVSGTAGDSLGHGHRGMAFTTKDRDNDRHSSSNCAVGRRDAWWYNRCCDSNLNGLYLHGSHNWNGLLWYHWKHNTYSLKRSQMKIRGWNPKVWPFKWWSNAFQLKFVVLQFVFDILHNDTRDLWLLWKLLSRVAISVVLIVLQCILGSFLGILGPGKFAQKETGEKE